MCRADDGGAWLYMEIETKGLKDYNDEKKNILFVRIVHRFYS